MIAEIPTPDEYGRAGLDSLYLAWQIAMRSIVEFAELQQTLIDDDGSEIDPNIYFRKSQPALGNAYGLVQQAAEFALKGRIAAVSPFLLIARDPKDWPKGVSSHDVPFSEFRTLDASDLVKVYNAVAAQKLDNEFQSFWDQLRRDRNKIIHSVTAESIDPATLLNSILTVNQTLFEGERWPGRLLQMQSEGTWAEYGLYSYNTQNFVMYEIEKAIEQLKPTACNEFFGFNKRRRSYMCPSCLGKADTDLIDKIPKLAQLVTRKHQETNLLCAVCEVMTVVERSDCNGPYCKANVISDGCCLSCNWQQDCPCHFQSGLSVAESQAAERYDFRFRRASEMSLDCSAFLDESAAIEHARLAMAAPHLSSWEMVEVRIDPYLGMRFLDPDRKAKILGRWIRNREYLEWQEGHGS